MKTVKLQDLPMLKEILESASKGGYPIYSYNNTDLIKNDQLEQIFDSVNFEFRRCLDNAKEFHNRAKNLGVQYAYGITFFQGVPTFHAWNLYKGNVIDGSILISEKELDKKISNKEYASRIVSEYKKNTPNHQKFIFGKVPKDVFYIQIGDDFYALCEDHLKFTDMIKRHLKDFPDIDITQGTPLAQEVWSALKS